MCSNIAASVLNLNSNSRCALLHWYTRLWRSHEPSSSTCKIVKKYYVICTSMTYIVQKKSCDVLEFSSAVRTSLCSYPCCWMQLTSHLLWVREKHIWKPSASAPWRSVEASACLNEKGIHLKVKQRCRSVSKHQHDFEKQEGTMCSQEPHILVLDTA